MDKIMECKRTYFGDTGYGAVMASRVRCSRPVAPRAAKPKKATVEESEYSGKSYADFYSMFYGMTGYAGNIISSMWRSWTK